MEKSDKLQMVNAIASSYIAKNVPISQQEAVGKAIAKQATVREEKNILPSIPIYDHKAPSQNQEEKSRPPVEREAEHVR